MVEGAGSSYENALAKAGLSRQPGTGRMILPYREKNGEYRTGLDADALYIQLISDPTTQKVEKERVSKERKRLEDALKIDLSSRSSYYNISSWSPTGTSQICVEPVKLIDGKNYFDLSNPIEAVTYAWLKAHPDIASSFDAYQRGEFPDARFYVQDDDAEQELTYRKNCALNTAIIKLGEISLEKRKKIARQCGLNVSDSDKEQVVYNKLDKFIKQGKITTGAYEGSDASEIFMRFITMGDEVLHVKDLVKQALTHSIYRPDKGGRIKEGQIEIAKSEDELIDFLLDEKNQSDLLLLEDKLKAKKSMML